MVVKLVRSILVDSEYWPRNSSVADKNILFLLEGDFLCLRPIFEAELRRHALPKYQIPRPSRRFSDPGRKKSGPRGRKDDSYKPWSMEPLKSTHRRVAGMKEREEPPETAPAVWNGELQQKRRVIDYEGQCPRAKSQDSVFTRKTRKAYNVELEEHFRQFTIDDSAWKVKLDEAAMRKRPKHKTPMRSLLEAKSTAQLQERRRSRKFPTYRAEDSVPGVKRKISPLNDDIKSHSKRPRGNPNPS